MLYETQSTKQKIVSSIRDFCWGLLSGIILVLFTFIHYFNQF